MGLAFIAGSQLLGGQQGLVEFIGCEDATTLLVNKGRSDRDGGGERPFDRVNDLGRLGALAWSSTRAIAWRCTHRDLRQECGVSFLRTSRQRLLRIRFTGKRLTADLLEQLLVDRTLRLGAAVRRGDEPPALGDPTRGRGQAVRAIARGQRGHRRWIGLCECGLRVTHRRRDPGDPLALRLGELLEVVGGREGTISYQRGRPIRGLSLGKRVLAHLAELVRITAIATQRLHQDRNASLVLDKQLQHHVVEVRPMIPAGASGDVHDLRLGLLLTVRTAVDVKAGAIEVGKGRGQSQTLCRGGGNETGEFRDAVVIEGIQGTTEGIIIELCRDNAGRNESRGGLILEEPGDEGERLVDKPQTIEHHRFDGFPDGEVSHCRVLLRRFVSDVAYAKFVKHARDEAKVI